MRREFILPNLQNPPEKFEEMTKYIANGLWCFNPLDPYNEVIFMAKRLVGVPNYYYFESEFPPNYDKKKLELYNYSRFDRVFIFLSIITRQFTLRCFIIRWICNFGCYINEFFIRYLPWLACIKFGWRNAYVDIHV